MATATNKPRGPNAIQVTDMPPLHVTTEGIPADEHLGSPPQHEAEREARRRLRDRITWVVAGLLVIAFLCATAVLHLMAPPTGPQGISSWEWTQYRSGERVAIGAEANAPVTPNSPFTGPPMTAIAPLGALQPPYDG